MPAHEVPVAQVLVVDKLAATAATDFPQQVAHVHVVVGVGHAAHSGNGRCRQTGAGKHLVDSLVHIGIGKLIQLSLGLHVVQSHQGAPVERCAGIVPDSRRVRVIHLVVHKLLHAVARHGGHLHRVGTLVGVASVINHIVDGLGQTAVAHSQQSGDRNLAVGIDSAGVVRVLRGQSLGLAVLEEIGVEGILGDAADRRRRAGVVDRAVHEHILLILLQEDDFGVGAQSSAERVVRCLVAVADRIGVNQRAGAVHNLGEVLFGTGVVILVIAGKRTLVETGLRLHGSGKVAAVGILAALGCNVLRGERKVLQSIVHHGVAFRARAEQLIAVAGLKSLRHQRHIAVAAHQLVVLVAADQAGDCREVLLLCVRQIATLHTLDDEVGATDIDVRVVPARRRSGHVDVLPVRKLVATGGRRLVVAETGEVELAAARAVAVARESLVEIITLTQHVARVAPVLHVGSLNRLRVTVVVQQVVAARKRGGDYCGNT